MNENIVTVQQALEQLLREGWTPPGDFGSVDIAPLVGRMTGLDMTKYELRALPNMQAWEVVRRA